MKQIDIKKVKEKATIFLRDGSTYKVYSTGILVIFSVEIPIITNIGRLKYSNETNSWVYDEAIFSAHYTGEDLHKHIHSKLRELNNKDRGVK